MIFEIWSFFPISVQFKTVKPSKTLDSASERAKLEELKRAYGIWSSYIQGGFDAFLMHIVEIQYSVELASLNLIL